MHVTVAKRGFRGKTYSQWQTQGNMELPPRAENQWKATGDRLPLLKSQLASFFMLLIGRIDKSIIMIGCKKLQQFYESIEAPTQQQRAPCKVKSINASTSGSQKQYRSKLNKLNNIARKIQRLVEIISRYLVDALWSNHISTLKQQANKNYGLELRAVWERTAKDNV